MTKFPDKQARALTLSLTFLLLLLMKPASATAGDICTISKFRSSYKGAREIKYVQWRQCLFAGRSLYYMKIYTLCPTRNCSSGWARAKPYGHVFLSTHRQNNVRRIIQTYFPTQNAMNLHIHSTYSDGKTTRVWKLALQRQNK